VINVVAAGAWFLVCVLLVISGLVALFRPGNLVEIYPWLRRWARPDSSRQPGLAWRVQTRLAGLLL